MSRPAENDPPIVLTIACEVTRVVSHRESPVEVARRIMAELTADGWRPPARSERNGLGEQAAPESTRTNDQGESRA